MQLTQWASDPFSSPPPIPFETPPYGPRTVAYAIGHIPPEALAEDLAAIGLAYASGYGNGYRLAGQPITPYAASEVIAGIFRDAATGIRDALNATPGMTAYRATTARMERLSGYELAAGYLSRDMRDEQGRLSESLARQLASFPVDPAQLDMSAASLAATADAIMTYDRTRTQAREHFKRVMPTARATTADRLGAFLDGIPAGLIERKDLRKLAKGADLDSIGQRDLYRAAAEHYSPGDPAAALVTVHGVRCFRVP